MTDKQRQDRARAYFNQYVYATRHGFRFPSIYDHYKKPSAAKQSAWEYLNEHHKYVAVINATCMHFTVGYVEFPSDSTLPVFVADTGMNEYKIRLTADMAMQLLGIYK